MAAGGRTGRPPLTEERKAETRLEIARAAVDLFVAQGVSATTGEQIGQAVGVSARTVWRYFPSKEACVRPLFAAGIEAIADCLRAWRPGRPLEEAFADAVPTDSRLARSPDRATMGALVRLTRDEPGLRAEWLQSYDEAEPAFARALAERSGLPADGLRPTIQAAMFNAALRAAVEHYAWRVADESSDPATAEAELTATMRSALAVAAEGLA
ncbi:TetR/AcrR family transcriptional regulator [Streptomyces sp. 900105755]|uniref:TetR/AcrR family transcriptional regulator n=1 Tax=unclassified Streptomyces TaxID=2593676 RepID=UPI00089C8CAC|nr:TetR/AcrR family transcriptional regulator [Streptomyces sp. Ag109_O5-10]SED85425.1 DNA-binding transcriptional regulator, AcrR family [Streptomyces sp. Ag109_O5-10]